ncbi:N-acetylmuramidase family protein [Ideonella sp. YS5]|uniref:N-acetylmuramidase family protein n=1 Tax=Ideonella sp. YS5 TaxID=3453714 RepID=UPI003EEEAAF9
MSSKTPTGKKTADKPVPPNPIVTASFVILDRLKQPIQGLTVRVTSKTIDVTGTTDEHGLAITIENATRNEEISIYVKKRNGAFELKRKVSPKYDINTYTIRSPELHLEATTKLTPKEELEEDLPIPSIREGEVLTSARLFGDLAPFIGAAQIVTEVGQVTKDFPTKTTKKNADAATGKTTNEITVEHHYRVVKTEKPKVIVCALLGSRLNYPTHLDVSMEVYASMAKEFGCEIAAIRAVAETESSGKGYFENGLPKILFERHRFYALTDPNRNAKKGAAKITHPFRAYADICNPIPGGYSIEEAEYARLVKAARLNRDAAIMACSWGSFQVLAEYYKQCDFKSPYELVDACMRSSDGHIALFRGFLKMPEKKKAIEALKSKNWEQFTKYYNGGNWEKQNPDYPKRMATYYEKYKEN